MVYRKTHRVLREPIMDISFYAVVGILLLMIYQLMVNK